MQQHREVAWRPRSSAATSFRRSASRAVQPSAGTTIVSLPATTSAFATANIFARASGYIDKREVDIGDHVKAGQLLAEIVAPELDHQIAQAEATLGQLKASLQQAQANRELAKVTWDRDGPLVKQGWLTRAARHHRRSDPEGTASGGRGRAGQRRCRGGPAPGAAPAEDLSAGRRAVRWRHHPAQHRHRQPGAGRCDQRHLHVHDHAGQRHPHPGRSCRRTRPSACSRESTPWCTFRKSRIARFPGKVTRIADALQPGSRTLLTEIDIPNPDGVLTPGNLLHDRIAHPAQDAELHGLRRTQSFSTKRDCRRP